MGPQHLAAPGIWEWRRRRMRRLWMRATLRQAGRLGRQTPRQHSVQPGHRKGETTQEGRHAEALSAT
eukprot:1134502-Pelagomonas_calceolata.AAC.3